MRKIIVIKFAELYLKGHNRPTFINILFENIKKVLSNFNLKISKKFDCIQISNFDYEMKIISILKKVPGIGQIRFVYKTETDINKICEVVDNLGISEGTFKVETKRKFKNFMSSMDIKTKIATYLLKKYPDLRVDVKNPERTIYIEIDKNSSYVYENKIKGLGGFPTSTAGKVLSLISGGIDSPVASYLLQKKGFSVDYLTFITSEVTRKTLVKIINLINIVTSNGKIYKPTFYIVDFTNIQKELSHSSDEKYRITLMRRSFYRIAKLICESRNYQAVVCGDSLGQVASQTVESINCINNACDISIFRPLLTYDKEEIIKIAKNIGTYNLSL